MRHFEENNNYQYHYYFNTAVCLPWAQRPNTGSQSYRKEQTQLQGQKQRSVASQSLAPQAHQQRLI